MKKEGEIIVVVEMCFIEKYGIYTKKTMGKGMLVNSIYILIIGYISLYLVIWIHEVGHGIMYAKYKCKENPFKVHVPFYLFFSTPRPVDEEKAKVLSHKQIYNIGIIFR